MRIGHRRGVVEGVVIGTAVASRRPPTVVVPAAYPVAYPAAYPAGNTVVAYGAGPGPTTEVIINTTGPAKVPPPSVPYYPPPQPAAYPPTPAPVATYPEPYVPGAANPPPYAPVVPPSAPAVLPPAAVAAGRHPNAAAVAGAEAVAIARAVERRHILIVNEANCSVLEVHRGNVKPNAQVVADKRRPDKPAFQIWYIDETGVIRSKLNDFAIESKDNGQHIRLVPYTGDARQKWTFQNNRIVNEVFRNDCIGLKKGLIRLKEDSDVVAGPYEGKPYQHWRIEYI